METVNESNRFNTINKTAFIGVISTLLILYTVNNIVSIEYFSKYISLPIYTIIPGTLIILSIWALSRADKIQEISKKSLFFLVLSFSSWFTAEQTGTGLGLVSCKNIIEQHGGKITVKNNPTTFTIALPKKSTH